jgi:hypothetical protein
LTPVLGDRQSIGKDVLKELKPMLDSWDQEEDQMARELQITSGKLGTALTEQARAIASAFGAARASAQVFLDNMIKTYNSLFGAYVQAVSEIFAKFPELTKNVLPALRESYETASNRIGEIYANLHKILQDIYQGSNVQAAIGPIIKAYRDAADGPTYKKLLEILKGLRSASTGDVKGAGPVGEFYGKVQSIRKERYSQILKFLDQLRKDAAKDPDYKETYETLDKLYGKLDWFVNYAKPQQQAMQAISAAYDSMASPPESKQFYNRSADGNTVTVNVPLYHDFNSLSDVAKALTPDRLESTFLEIMDEVEDAIDQLSGPDEAPDSDSYAVLSGEQDLVTFDGSGRTISADCSYLLARDFIDSRFSVIAQFENSKRKNIIVQYDDQSIEIGYNNEIRINGKTADLPFNAQETGTPSKIRVVQNDEFVVTLTAFNGLTIISNKFNHIVKVILTDRFRGKTNGLLGQNDGEPSTDLSLPNGLPAADLNAFMSAWATTPTCASAKNKVLLGAMLLEPAVRRHCEALLGARRSTYGRNADAESVGFHNALCLRDLRNAVVKQPSNPADYNKAVCQSLSTFFAANRLDSELPDQCLQCDTPNGKIELHATKKITAADKLKNVDVVFIVENRDCLASARKQIGPLAQKIDASIRQAGYDVQFGLIGFNGKGAHEQPAYQSVQGAVRFGANQLQQGVNAFAFEQAAQSLANPLNVIGDIVERYPFRPAARKLLVLFACSNCATLVELDYYDLQTKLLGQSFSLHIVTTQQIQLSDDSKEKFIGFDASSFIKADLKENLEARQNLVEPHDSCTVLAQETNGTVFSIADNNNLTPVTAALAKALTQTAAGNTCSACECQAHDNYPRTSCQRCEIPRPAVLTADKSGFFNNPFQKIAKLQQQP